MPEVTVEEFLTRYRNKHNAYYDVADDILIEKVLEKYPVYKDKLTDYTSPEVKKLVKENNPWLDNVKLENPWGKSFENSSLLPQNSGIQKSMMAEDMRETVNAKMERQRDVINAFKSLDPDSQIISNADEQGEGLDDGEFAIDTSVGTNNLTDGPELYVNEYSLDPAIRKRQLEDLQKRWRLEPKRIEDQRIKQTELALAGQPIDQALQLEQYSNSQTPMLSNQLGSEDLDPNLQNLSTTEQSEEIQLRNQMNVGSSSTEDVGDLRRNALIVDEFEAQYGPGVSDTKTLFGGLNYRETVQNPEAFSQWLYDAKSGKIQAFAYDRILKGGPTPEMIVYANKKYGATSKEEVAEKISEAPNQP